jgi:hypothetical protein
MCLALAVGVGPVRADTITVNGFNNDTPATVTFDDGVGHSGTTNTLLTQFHVTFTGGPGGPVTFNTFSIDLAHSVSVGQTYVVNVRGDVATAFTNGARIAYVFQTFGLPDLTNHPERAAAAQIVLWDLSLNNHNPTFFGPDLGGTTYSSGDPSVFRVALGGNPDASQIAALANQYLQASVGAAMPGAWLDAAAAGDAANRGESLLLSTPEPSSLLLSVVAAGCLFTRTAMRASRARQPIHSGVSMPLC